MTALEFTVESQPTLFTADRRVASTGEEDTEGPLRAVVERVTFTSADSGWSVLSIRCPDGQIEKAVGPMLDPHEGDMVALHGEWVNDKHWGRQFKFTSYAPQPPADAAQAEEYLAKGRIKGIGPSIARRIVERFGDDTLRILDEEIERLVEIKGISPKKLEVIAEGWTRLAKQHAIALALMEVGASTSLAPGIWEAFGADGAATIRTNPYALTKAKGIGFTTCDKIAMGALGWDRSDPRRVSAGLAYTLENAQTDGHCYLPIAVLIEQAVRLLGVRPDKCAQAVALAVGEERVVVEEERAYTRHMHYLESDLAQHLRRLAEATVAPPSPTQQAQIEALLAERGLTAEQEQAVRAVLEQPLTVLTGGPGVGKSHTVATVALAAAICRWRVELCAPTGRAAKRMSELADGTPAATVHRLIGLGTGENGAARVGPEDPLSADLVVCDESSMLDVSLARYLTRAIKRGARLLLVGDIDQLPSVGPGSVLRDLITSGIARTTALTQIFRQKAASGIVQVAHQVNAGTYPQLKSWPDLHFWSVTDADAAAEGVVDMVCKRIPAKFGPEGITAADIQVLAPQRKGSCGVVALNTRLQQELNPSQGIEYDASIGEEAIRYRPGDRVMVVKNNYEKGPDEWGSPTGVFNGTPARVVSVNPQGGDEAVVIETDEGHTIPYAASEIRELALAYAVTIHKSQGSQYPCVVIPVTMQSYQMLVRNLIYTAITRAQSRVVLVGSPKALAKAVKTVSAAKRYTGLAERVAAHR
jgi:exodeoxyribonuclease V alpha subunit